MSSWKLGAAWPRVVFTALAVLGLMSWGAQAQPLAPQPPHDDLVGRLRVGALNNQPVSVLSRPNDVSTPSVMAANFGVDEILPQTKTEILLPTAHVLPNGLRDGILINLAEYRLYYMRKGVVVASAPVGIGMPKLPTPTGKTSIVAKKKNPTWIPTAVARREHPDWPASVEPGITNPLGAYALYLGWEAYLIHGSTNEFGIGRPFTRGCIRVWANDIETLFNEVPVGTKVEVVDQPVKLGWHENELFIEAHPDLAQLDELRANLSFTPKPAEDLHATITAAAGARAADVDWGVVTAALERRSGIPTQITSPAAHPIDLMEHNMVLSAAFERAIRTQKGFGAVSAPANRTDEEKRVIEELRQEQLRKDPYNI